MAFFKGDTGFYKDVLGYYFKEVTQIYSNEELQIIIFKVTPPSNIEAIAKKLNLMMAITFEPIKINGKTCNDLILLSEECNEKEDCDE